MSHSNGVPAVESSARKVSSVELPGILPARRGRWHRFCAVFLLGGTLLFTAVPIARAETYVVFGDSALRTAVASQLVKQGQIPPGSDGTTITLSDIATLTTLSAPNEGIVRLDGLEDAVNLTSLTLSGNKIADIGELSGLTKLAELDLSGNNLDLAPGSSATLVIAALQSRGAHVSYGSQRARLSKLDISSSASTYGKSVIFSANFSPPGAAVGGTSQLRLYHLETKTVTKKVKGKKKKVAVNYWRLRRTLTMTSSPTGRVTATSKLPYAGNWQAHVACTSSGEYQPCASNMATFVVQDPRIQAAISWGMRNLGSHAWDHYCLRFVGDCYARGARASVHRYDTARQAAAALHASAHRDFNAPRGAWVFYDSTKLGHVGISLGNGTMINDYGSQGVKIMGITQAGHYVGWAVPPLSPAITDWNQPTK